MKAAGTYGWFFPSAMDPTKPISHGTLYAFVWRQRQRDVVSLVTDRDLRRTWKTLAGRAGVPKEIRDRIQNHSFQDVSSKSYSHNLRIRTPAWLVCAGCHYHTHQ